MPPLRAARAVRRIIEQGPPHLRYTVGAQATLLALLRRVMPQRGFEMLVQLSVHPPKRYGPGLWCAQAVGASAPGSWL